MKTTLRPYRYLKFADLETVFDELCSDTLSNFTQSRIGRTLTFGSCFANNLASELRMQGIDGRSVAIVEYANTPRANLFYVECALGEREFAVNTDVETPISEAAISEIKTLLTEVDTVVFTLGVAYNWHRRSDNSIVFIPDIRQPKNYLTTFETPQEHSKTLLDLVRKIRRVNKNCSIWMTLSPVPLEFSFNYRSAIVSDCVSKSILRTAIHLLQMELKIFYLPTFEFFRWVSGHSPRSFYGADGKVRHVDSDLVNLVVRKFINLHAMD